jgi:hypothetical protein
MVFNEGMTTTVAKTLATTEQGTSRYIWQVAVGEYIWHRGAFRLVTAVEGTRTVRMGRYALHSSCLTVEWRQS